MSEAFQQSALAQAVGVLRFEVHHLPAPQGNHTRNRAGAIYEKNPATARFRDAVTIAALEARRITGHVTFTGPVAVDVTFTLPRPQGHYGTGGNTHRLRPNAPRWPATKPDVDKMLRSLFDSLTDAQVFRDDSRVVACTVIKAYPHGSPGSLSAPGACVTVREMT